MLNFFKFPFRTFSRSSADELPSKAFEAGLIANLLRNNSNLSSDDLDNAMELTSREMDDLRLRLKSCGEEDSYDEFTAALRRIEAGLQG